ncbi:hypothetical protein DER45DRAFT_535928 [Fusarium avenaceum]|nr:hypothetical protein DER45DRAFT_535928 [Fusarium avenaceum]
MPKTSMILPQHPHTSNHLSKRQQGSSIQMDPSITSAQSTLLIMNEGLFGGRLTHKAKRISSQRSPEVAKSRQSPQQWASSSFSSMWQTPSRMIDDQTRSEDIWGRYLDRVTAPAHAYTDLTESRNMRINIEWHDKRPGLDAIEQMEDIERHAMHRMSHNCDINIAAHKLVASCFYLEKASVHCQSREGGVYKCSGNIFCRFDEGYRDLKCLGSILKDHIRGSVFVPFFVLEEDHGVSFQRQHNVVIPIQTIQQMRSSGTFRLPSHLSIDGRHESSLTRLSLRLEPEGYILSEIPSSFTGPETPPSPSAGSQGSYLRRTIHYHLVFSMMKLEMVRNPKESARKRSPAFTSSRPSSSEDRGAATANSKETGSVSSGRRDSSEELPSKVADIHSESGYWERNAPFRGYY